MAHDRAEDLLALHERFTRTLTEVTAEFCCAVDAGAPVEVIVALREKARFYLEACRYLNERVKQAIERESRSIGPLN